MTVRVAATKGSVPREVGAMMRVFAKGQDGTIGGGALEWEAARVAREMLARGSEGRRVMPLGPDLGQCCGGVVTLEFVLSEPAAEPPGTLWIWGAGHVGRAVAAVLAPMGQYVITLVDTAADRFPASLPDGVAPLVAVDPVRALAHAPKDAAHLIMTYSHEIDLALCDGLLRHGFDTVGLIGSATKWARFQRRLHALGHSADEIARITCPIGDPTLGKHPQAIAIGVAMTMLRAGDMTVKDRVE